jgi:Right handed beta helix region
MGTNAMQARLALATSTLFLFLTPHALGGHAKDTGANHYVNSADPAADDSGPGTKQHPWKSLAGVKSHSFKPGDSVYFARGSSYTGALVIANSGVPGKPITFAAYGSGTAPRFTNPSYSLLNGNMIQVRGRWIVIDGLCFHDGVPAPPPADPNAFDNGDLDPAPRTVAAVFIARSATHVIVRHCEAINSPVAIRSYGEYALITNNYFHDCTTQFLSAPNWGPVAIMLMVSRQEVSYNRIEHYYMVGGTWGADGGAVEIDDQNPKKYMNIHHNKVYDTQGFLETDGGGPYTNITVAYNEADVTEKFIGMTHCRKWLIANNTIIRVRKRPGYNDANWFNSGTSDTVWRNNIFVLANGLQTFAHGLGAKQIHDHNLYFSVDDSTMDPIPGTPGTGDKVGDPLFVDYAKRDYHLTAKSPAVRAGIALGFTTDLDEKTLPAGKATDMGAYEYTSAANR